MILNRSGKRKHPFFIVTFPSLKCQIPGHAPFPLLPAESLQCSCGAYTFHSLSPVSSTLIPGLLSPRGTTNDTGLSTDAAPQSNQSLSTRRGFLFTTVSPLVCTFGYTKTDT